MAERCVCCGEIIPEGQQTCPGCEKGKRKMANEKLIEATADCFEEVTKIKTHFAKIIVEGTAESRITAFCIMTLRRKSIITDTAHITSQMYSDGFPNGLKLLNPQPWKMCR